MGIAEQLQFLLYLQVFRTTGFCSPSTFPINVFLIYPNSETKKKPVTPERKRSGLNATAACVTVVSAAAALSL